MSKDISQKLDDKKNLTILDQYKDDMSVTHKTAWDQHWGGDETLKLVLEYLA